LRSKTASVLRDVAVSETPFSTTVRPQLDTRSLTSRLEVIPRTCRDGPHAREDRRIWLPAIRVREPAPHSNELAVEAVRKYPDRFAIMGWFYLDDPNGRDLVE
jgi:hypothetical protein